MEYYVMTRFQNLQFLKSEQTLEKKHFNHWSAWWFVKEWNTMVKSPEK